jgi:hypothetical protein
MKPTTRRSGRRLALALAALLGSSAAPLARADTVDAKSDTLLILRDQSRAGVLYTIAPLYELLTVSARNVQNPVADDLAFVFSGWGAVSLGKNLVWYDVNPPERRVFGDLDLAFAQGELFKRSLQLRLGRQIVAGGVTGSLQLDGGSALVRLPLGFGATAYVGSPVAQRFHAGDIPTSFNPYLGNFAVGGRAFWTSPRWGELGGSVVEIRDDGDPGRQQVGGDLRFTPVRELTLFANGNYDLHESRWAEANVLAQFLVVRKLIASVDARHVEPDLLLSRTSILSVFAVDKRNEFGGSLQYGPWRAITAGADYHFLKRQGRGDGHRVNGRVTWQPRPSTTVGGEFGYQSIFTSASAAMVNNGYYAFRAFGAQTYQRFTGSLDLQEYRFRNEINGEKNSFTAIGTLAYALGCSWSALVSGDAGQTPYYDRRFGMMVKLAYNHSYQFREVR